MFSGMGSGILYCGCCYGREYDNVLSDIQQVQVMPNEHLEYFKRFAVSYLRWAFFNFDRIVADTVKRHEK